MKLILTLLVGLLVLALFLVSVVYLIFSFVLALFGVVPNIQLSAISILILVVAFLYASRNK